METVTVSIDRAGKAIGVGRTKLYELIAQGQLDTVKLGRRRLVKVSSIHKLVGAA